MRPYETAKRALDLGVAIAGSVLLSPVIAAVAVAVRVSMGKPVLFRQARTGYRGHAFDLIKFRTMCAPAPGEGGPEFDERRLTRLGRVLRAASVDELPSLWNVALGQLSLVGPRPLPVRYLPRYSAEQARRHEVQPGMTGWAQVNGRNLVGWDERFALDVWYVDHRSLPLDLRILARTVIQVLRRSGISQEGHATMPEFEGPVAQP